MKKYLLILTLLLGSFSIAHAQENEAGDENSRVKALYVAYVTQQLKLTPEEAQKFWPVHTQFENELKSIKPDLPELDKQQARLDIKKKYQENFSRIIGPGRCERFFRMGDDFRKKLLENRNKRMDQRPRIRRGQ